MTSVVLPRELLPVLTQDLADVFPVGIYMCEAPSGAIRFYNRRAAELWGRVPEPAGEYYCGALRLFRPDGRPISHAESPMALALAQKTSQYDHELIVERPD